MLTERIAELRKAKGMNMKQLSQALGLPYTTYVNYEKGEREPNSEVLIRIAEYFGVSTDHLLGRAENTASGQAEDIFEKYPQLSPLPRSRKVPLLGAVACGEPIFREEDELVSLPDNIKADFCLECVGDSMINARIHSGDIVFIKAMPMVENGEIAAVSVDNEVTLKRVYYYPERNKLVLTPENPAYEPFVYTNEELDNIRILGKAVYFLSKVR